MVPGLDDDSHLLRAKVVLQPYQSRPDDGRAPPAPDDGGAQAEPDVNCPGLLGQGGHTGFGPDAHVPKKLIGAAPHDGVVAVGRGGYLVGLVIDRPRAVVVPTGDGRAVLGAHLARFGLRLFSRHGRAQPGSRTAPSPEA